VNAGSQMKSTFTIENPKSPVFFSFLRRALGKMPRNVQDAKMRLLEEKPLLRGKHVRCASNARGCMGDKHITLA
jgi:hypothetical protein